MNVWRAPSLDDAFSGGAVAETSTVAAATVPVSEPCSNLSRSSCQGDVTSPISPSINDPARVARNSIFFCPYLSPSLPHSGAARAIVTAVAVLSSPGSRVARVLDPEPLYVERQEWYYEHEPRRRSELRDEQDPER